VRCKIDENLPVEAAGLLNGGGHECHTVFDEQLAGADDASLYERCRREGRVLLTLDLDFADIRTYPPDESPGIIVLRPDEPDRDRVLHLMREVVPALDRETVAQSLWIVEESRIRIRRSGDAAV
jgi:predicted nuclease of predicted toxin-antitoxin system